jgi:hypothetical protein
MCLLSSGYAFLEAKSEGSGLIGKIRIFRTDEEQEGYHSISY